MRHLILDTETTGLSVKEGHRIIEIGAVEMVNLSFTGRSLHLYINPERDIDAGAQEIHGLSSEFLSDKPVFGDILSEFNDFIGNDLLVIHNAPFDMGFLNAELARLDRPVLPMDRSIDTLMMARKKFPGAQANLDALCRRFEIDNDHRDLHGALVDADLLASVYIELLGGKQPGLGLDGAGGTVTGQNKPAGRRSSDSKTGMAGDGNRHFAIDDTVIRPVRPHAPSADEQAAHDRFLDGMENPIWRQADG